jgi:hypothetical protein
MRAKRLAEGTLPAKPVTIIWPSACARESDDGADDVVLVLDAVVDPVVVVPPATVVVVPAGVPPEFEPGEPPGEPCVTALVVV